MTVHIIEKEKSYELLDSGEGMKLERFGEYVLARPDPETLWKKKLSEKEWEQADALYKRTGTTGSWKTRTGFPKSWNIEYAGLTFELRPTSFKHVGIFPEQKTHWGWMEKKIKDKKEKMKDGEQLIQVLNLFAYTGGATLAAARAGASVTHLDASKVAVTWARKNAELSGLSEKPIRWIVDDALLFLKREAKRGNTYDVVIMDPPAFGHGPDGTLWKIEKDFYALFEGVLAVLSEKPLAVVLNGYTAGYSPLTLANGMEELTKRFGGKVESGELAIAERDSERLLPAGVFARWSA